MNAAPATAGTQNSQENMNETVIGTENGSRQTYTRDLCADLNGALAGNFDFKGSFYHSLTSSNAPNPSLVIEGIGLIGLPLPERDAQLLISRAAQAPFGKGDQTLIDTTVRDTWEIDPACATLKNPKWHEYVDELASVTIWTALGAAPWSTRPRCELYKILLYQAGSHFLPHQDTYKADGMFATVVFVLPSAFEGGEVHVSHSGQKAVIDVAKGSEFNTSVLAWYTDVVHEVKPITSGYRLALSYNLINTSPSIPRPSLSTMHTALTVLREVLVRWKNGEYELEQEPPLMAYVLSHEYSPSDFKKGSQCLKGSDAHKAAHILPLAQELGFSVCLANLTYVQHGYADDYGECYYKRGRYDSDEDDDEDESEDDKRVGGGGPDMVEVLEEEYEIKNCVSVSEGKSLDLGEFTISRESVIPEGAFDGKSPNRTEYEGYMGNESGTLDYWYDRSVLVIFRKEDEISVLMDVKGTLWAINTLDISSSPPTPDARIVAARALSDLRAGRGSALECARPLMNYAISWKDPQLWNEAFPYCGSQSVETIGEGIETALGAFGLASIQAGIEEYVGRSSEFLQKRIKVIESVSNLVRGDDAGPAWTDGLLRDAVSSYTANSVDDIPTVILALQKVGLEVAQTRIIRNVSNQNGSYLFLAALSKGLYQHREEFSGITPSIQDGGSSPTASLTVGDVIHECVLAAIRQWDATAHTSNKRTAHIYSHTSRSNTSNSPSSGTDRIAEMVDLCFTVGEMESCSELLAMILEGKDGDDIADTFKSIYVPLIPKLRKVLKKHKPSRNQSLSSSPPLATFFRNLVSKYLVHVLGSKTAIPKLNRNIKCGPTCEDCTRLEAWLNDLNAMDEFKLKAVAGRRQHLEMRISYEASDLLTKHTITTGSPHTLVVAKVKGAMARYTWSGRQAAAMAFLKAVEVGEKKEWLKEVMGERYADVLKAVQGEQAFTPVEPTGEVAVGGDGDAGVAASAQRTSVAGTAALSNFSSLSSGVNVAGTTGRKRKQREPPKTTPIDFIDLT
ncbi:hypothetical protein EST38_g8644 [Candolleomyces aberdarensis]|uniref:Prolyl 4-hydroxylase alpha subunit Fe(2+) 2OG dioxygenase domain-containing protein n=1 Tax=Candolleomyces aberdarensis TaxID=2316362 RepID=A0A4Q2DEW2_9AGAR|nr:hypothetical protein EST38_g8644 [Candolleomyces aberdarensis]